LPNKITTVPKSKLGAQVGRLDDEDIVRLNQAMTVFLGMAVTPRAGRGNSHDFPAARQRAAIDGT